MGYRSGYVHNVRILKLVEALLVVYRLLGGLSDERHCAHCLHRVQTCGGLAGEHYCAGAVVDSVGNVGGLRTCGARILYHGLQHLGRGYYLLVGVVALLYQHFLDLRDLLEGYFNAHIAARYHYAVGNMQDRIDVANAVAAFDLRDYADIRAAFLLKYLADLQDIVRAGDKACRNKIEVLLSRKADIALVHLADVGHGELHAGNVNALVVGENAAVKYRAHDIGRAVAVVLYLVAAEDNIAVVDEDTRAGGNIPRKSLVAYGSALYRAFLLAGGEDECASGEYLGLYAALEFTQPYLGPLGVEQGSYGLAGFLGYADYAVVIYLVALMRAVRKVLAGNVHAVVYKGAQYLVVLGRRTQCAYYLCSSHVVHSVLVFRHYAFSVFALFLFIISFVRQEINPRFVNFLLRIVKSINAKLLLHFHIVNVYNTPSPGKI